MAYNIALAARLRAHLGQSAGLTEKKMFGGVAYMIDGNMAVGIHGDDLIVRVGPEQYEWAISQKHVRVFALTGRPMKGWVQVAPEGIASEEDLMAWVRRGEGYARSLPPK